MRINKLFLYGQALILWVIEPLSITNVITNFWV